MKRYMPWMVVPFLAWAGCDSDNGNPSDTGDTTSDTRDTADTSVNDVPSPDVDTDVEVTPVTPNAACSADAVDRNVYGAQYPWGGIKIGDTNYTCNSCPGGLQDFQGAYRAHGYADDQTTPDYGKANNAATGDAELLVIDGNTWYNKRYDKQDNVTYESRGWFFCSQQPEQPNKHLFWVTTDVIDNGGAAELVPGFVKRTDVILSQGGTDRKLISWFDEITGPKNVQVGYCRIGSTFGGKLCNNPYN